MLQRSHLPHRIAALAAVPICLAVLWGRRASRLWAAGPACCCVPHQTPCAAWMPSSRYCVLQTALAVSLTGVYLPMIVMKMQLKMQVSCILLGDFFLISDSNYFLLWLIDVVAIHPPRFLYLWLAMLAEVEMRAKPIYIFLQTCCTCPSILTVSLTAIPDSSKWIIICIITAVWDVEQETWKLLEEKRLLVHLT